MYRTFANLQDKSKKRKNRGKRAHKDQAEPVEENKEIFGTSNEEQLQISESQNHPPQPNSKEPEEHKNRYNEQEQANEEEKEEQVDQRKGIELI